MEKRIRIRPLFPLLTLIALLASSCSFLQEISTLGKCEFRLGTLTNHRIAGVDVSQVDSYADLSLMEVGSISASALQGRLPLSFTLNVEVRNPNPATAALNRMEYMAYIDDVEVAQGTMSQRVEIPANGGMATLPLDLRTDLIELLNRDSRQALVNFGLNLAGAGNQPTRVTLKVKPTILVGAVEINYPGYISVKQEFTSGD